MHSVSVYEQHQNAKLLVTAIPDHNGLSQMVYGLGNQNYMIKMCIKCLEKSALKDYLMERFLMI